MGGRMRENGIFLIETGCMLAMDQLKPYKGNAKLHPKEQVEQIAESIKEFGFDDPIGIWGEENLIVEGHGRYLALKKLGITHVPCIRLDHLTDEERRAYTLAHNQTTMTSGFDAALLDLELSEISLDMSRFGFELTLAPEEAQEDDYEPEVPEEPTAKPGDIYQLGRHRLMCGDSTSTDDVAKLMAGAEADTLVTDPPYNVDYKGTAGKIKHDNMEDSAFRQFLRDAFSAASSVMKAGASFYIWHADSEGFNFRGACRDTGWQVRQCLIWVKDALVLGRQDYQWQHEPCLYGWKDGTHKWRMDRKQTTTLNFPRPKKSVEHPTMKPIPLFDYNIRANTDVGDNVLDLFGGSGTTVMACEQNGRNAYVMELDPKYVDVIINRWETFTGAKAVLLAGGERPGE